MLFVNDEELKDRIEAPTNLLKIEHKRMHDKKRPVGSKNIPLDEKAAIGTLAKIMGPTEAAKATGVSVATASNASHGITTHKDGHNPELVEKVEKKNKNANNIALDLLTETLLGMKPEEIACEKPKTQSEIAKNLATIVEKTGDKGSNGVLIY
jgi:hypothetical protein